MTSTPADALLEQCVRLIEKSVHAMAGHAAHTLSDDDLYRRTVIDPAWHMMPLPIRLLGRERLGWDELFFRLRSEVFEVRGSELHLRTDARAKLLPILGKMLAPKLASLSQDYSPNTSQESRGTGTAEPQVDDPKPTSGGKQLAIGIDLGTTFSVIAHLDSFGRPWTIPNAEGDLITPSVVLFDGESIVVGKEALKAAVLEPERVAQFAKRDMGCEVYSHSINGERLPPEVIQSLVLEKVKRDGEAKLGPIREVVITVPAYFNEPRRKATQDAGRLAGLVPQVGNEDS
jgi:hypothetical protein